MRSALLLIGLCALVGCESQQPATKTGMFLDKAGTQTGQAVVKGADATGQALDKAGNYVKNKVDPD